MDWDSGNHEPSRKELMKKISKSLRALLRTLSIVNLDITIYQLTWHTAEHIRRHPSEWNKLDDAYTAYEEQANNCRRIWMKLRAVSEREASRVNVGGNSSAPGFRPVDRSPSPLEYLSESDEDEVPGIKMDQDVPMDLDPTERDIPRPPTPATDLPPHKPRQKVRLCISRTPVPWALSFNPERRPYYLAKRDCDSERIQLMSPCSYTKGGKAIGRDNPHSHSPKPVYFQYTTETCRRGRVGPIRYSAGRLLTL